MTDHKGRDTDDFLTAEDKVRKRVEVLEEKVDQLAELITELAIQVARLVIEVGTSG